MQTDYEPIEQVPTTIPENLPTVSRPLRRAKAACIDKLVGALLGL